MCGQLCQSYLPWLTRSGRSHQSAVPFQREFRNTVLILSGSIEPVLERLDESNPIEAQESQGEGVCGQAVHLEGVQGHHLTRTQDPGASWKGRV